jgi:hypothetical protein
MKVLDPVLVAMFILGGIGSVLVIAIGFVDNVREFFSKSE